LQSKESEVLNTELLRKVRDQIEREPRQFCMSHFYATAEDIDDDIATEIPNCGTAACIAGWAFALSKYLNPKDAGGLVNSPEFRARDLLGLGLKGYTNLFYSDDWPDEFRVDFSEAATPEARAAVAVRLLDEIIDGKRDPNTLEVIPG